jgi:hypothetical protein
MGQYCHSSMHVNYLVHALWDVVLTVNILYLSELFLWCCSTVFSFQKMTERLIFKIAPGIANSNRILLFSWVLLFTFSSFYFNRVLDVSIILFRTWNSCCCKWYITHCYYWFLYKYKYYKIWIFENFSGTVNFGKKHPLYHDELALYIKQ